MYSPIFSFSIISLRNFIYENKNGGHLFIVASQSFSQGPIYYIAVEAELDTDLREPEDIRSLSTVYTVPLIDSVSIWDTTMRFCKKLCSLGSVFDGLRMTQ
jgi:hypothetical protein